MMKKRIEVVNIAVNGSKPLTDFIGILKDETQEVYELGNNVPCHYQPPKSYALEIRTSMNRRSMDLMEAMFDFYRLQVDEGVMDIWKVEMIDREEPWITYSGEFFVTEFDSSKKHQSTMKLTAKSEITAKTDESKRPKFTIKDMSQKEIELAISGLKAIEKSNNQPGFMKLTATRAIHKLQSSLLS